MIETIEKTEFASRLKGIRAMLDQALNDFKGKDDLGEYFLNFKIYG